MNFRNVNRALVLIVAFTGICFSQIQVIKLSNEDAVVAKAFSVDEKILQKEYVNARLDAIKIAQDYFGNSYSTTLGSYPNWQEIWNWDISSDNYYAILLTNAQVIPLSAASRDRLLETSSALRARTLGYPIFVDGIVKKYLTIGGTIRRVGWETFKFSPDGQYIVAGSLK